MDPLADDAAINLTTNKSYVKYYRDRSLQLDAPVSSQNNATFMQICKTMNHIILHTDVKIQELSYIL
jgi:hypothetical protein